MQFPVEPVAVARTGQTIYALIDPRESRIYAKHGADVVRGDVISFRGVTRRVNDDPDLWAPSSSVIPFEAGPPFLPDLGTLYRAAAPSRVIDETTGEFVVFDASTPVWSGPCSVEPTQSDGSAPELGDQQVGVVPILITVPLALVDVRPGDLFKVTSSRDQRLLVRTLVVKAIRASSSATVREVLAFDNQGGVDAG